LKVPVFLIIASCIFAGNALCANWKYLGHQPLGEVDHYVYYDLESMKQSRHSVMTWIQYISKYELAKTTGDQFQSSLQQVKSKLENGYMPPYALYQQISDIKDIESIIIQEQKVVDFPYSAKFKGLVEINCLIRKQRVLQFMEYNGPELLSHDTEPGMWESIMPETIGDTMLKMFCDARYTRSYQLEQ